MFYFVGCVQKKATHAWIGDFSSCGYTCDVQLHLKLMFFTCNLHIINLLLHVLKACASMCSMCTGMNTFSSLKNIMKTFHLNKSAQMHINKCAAGGMRQRQRDEDKKRRIEDDERILWMDFSFPSDSRTSFTSAQMATWETGTQGRDREIKQHRTKEQNQKSTLRWSKHLNARTHIQ